MGPNRERWSTAATDRVRWGSGGGVPDIIEIEGIGRSLEKWGEIENNNIVKLKI